MASNAGSTTQTKDARRRTAARVAIPLPLTRPRNGTNTKPQVSVPVKTANDGDDKQSNGGSKEEEVAVNDTHGAEIAQATNDVAVGAVSEVETAPVHEEAQLFTNGSLPSTDELVEFRKPTQIRTELPPAFVPSRTPQTASSGAQSRFGTGQAPYSRPASTHMAFSTDDSGTPSPVPYSGYMIPNGTRHSPHASVFVPPPAHRPADSFNGYASPQHAHSRSNGHPRHQQRESYASLEAYDPRPMPEYPTVPPGYAALSPLPRHPIDDALALRQYVSSLYSSETFADVRLQLHFPQRQAFNTFTGHRMILARSPMLHKAVQHASQPMEVVKVELVSKWADERSTQEAIWSLYGGNLLAEGSDVASVPGDSNVTRLRYVLGYIAAGIYLELPAVAQRGVEVASSILTWDSLPTAFEFALEGGIPFGWLREAGKSRAVNDPSATMILHSIMNFMASQIPHDFQPDTAAQDLLELNRLPAVLPESARSVTHRASRSINDPRLTRLRFGEIGGLTSSTISSILFSLPIELLAAFFEHPMLASRFGIDNLAHVAQTVIGERESRRVKALTAFPDSSDLDFAEAVDIENNYIKLSRRRT